MATMSVHLFAGENAMILRGMDSYVDQYDDTALAMHIANNGEFEWAHIVEPLPTGLHTVNVGRWDERKRKMVWQDAPVLLSQHQIYLRTYQTVLREGVLLLGQLPVSRPRTKVVTAAIQLREDIQQTPGLNESETRAVIYLARQILGQLMRCIHRTPTGGALGKSVNKWLGAAAFLQNETRDIQFRIDVE